MPAETHTDSSSYRLIGTPPRLSLGAFLVCGAKCRFQALQIDPERVLKAFRNKVTVRHPAADLLPARGPGCCAAAPKQARTVPCWARMSKQSYKTTILAARVAGVKEDVH